MRRRGRAVSERVVSRRTRATPPEMRTCALRSHATLAGQGETRWRDALCASGEGRRLVYRLPVQSGHPRRRAIGEGVAIEIGIPITDLRDAPEMRYVVTRRRANSAYFSSRPPERRPRRVGRGAAVQFRRAPVAPKRSFVAWRKPTVVEAAIGCTGTITSRRDAGLGRAWQACPRLLHSADNHAGIDGPRFRIGRIRAATGRDSPGGLPQLPRHRRAPEHLDAIHELGNAARLAQERVQCAARSASRWISSRTTSSVRGHSVNCTVNNAKLERMSNSPLRLRPGLV